MIIEDPTITALNPYQGGAYQQAVSGVTDTNPNCYELGGTGCFSVYGFEYVPGFDSAVRLQSLSRMDINLTLCI